MSKLIEIHVTSVERPIFSGSFACIFAPAKAGEVGIFPGHTPFLSLLNPGCLLMRHEDDTTEGCYVGGGVIEVQPFLVTVLAYSALKTKELDEKSAQAAKANALRVLSESNATDQFNYQAARVELLAAMGQLSAIKRLRGK